MAEVIMPRLSDTMEEGTIAHWLKQPGDAVKRGEVLAQIETDKATMDLEAFEAGTLQEILVPEGTTVPIGQTVARIGAGAGTGSDQPVAAAASAPTTSQATPPAAAATGSLQPETPEARQNVAEAPDPPQTPTRDGTVVTSTPAPTSAAEPASPDGHANGNGNSNSSGNGEDGAGKLRASPLARRMAAEHGLDLAALEGSGPEGRVIRADVEAALQHGTVLAQAPEPPTAQPTPPAAPQPAPAPTAAATPATAPDAERVPLSQMRRTIARRMAESTSTVPHFFLTTTIDVVDLVQLRQQILDQLAASPEPPRLSLNDLLIKGAALALRQQPDMNVAFDGDAILRHRRVHIGMAVATERGLIVPVIRDADQKSVGQIARESRDLATRARDGKLQPAEYSGGTFSISNLGMFGVEQFQAVINPPEAGILAVGAVVREPAERNGQVEVRERMRVTLSVDHRAADGAVGARWLQAFKQLLEHPFQLLV